MKQTNKKYKFNYEIDEDALKMGMNKDELLSIPAACKFLHVTEKELWVLCKGGYIGPAAWAGSRNNPVFLKVEIKNFASLISETGLYKTTAFYKWVNDHHSEIIEEWEHKNEE